VHLSLWSVDTHSDVLGPGTTTSPVAWASVDAPDTHDVNVGAAATVDVSLQTTLEVGVPATCLYYNTTDGGYWDTDLVATTERTEDDAGVVHCQASVLSEYMALSSEAAERLRQQRLFGGGEGIEQKTLVGFEQLMFYLGMYLAGLGGFGLIVLCCCKVCKKSDSKGAEFDSDDETSDEEAPPRRGQATPTQRQRRGDGSFVQSNPMRTTPRSLEMVRQRFDDDEEDV